MKLLLGGNREVASVEIDDEDAAAVLAHTWWWDGKYAYTQVGPKIKRRNIRLHRFLLNPPEGMTVDHIDGDRTNYRRSNLRIASSSQNSANVQARIDNTSGYKGVSWSKRDNRWYASITHQGKQYNLGLHHTKEAAAAAYNEAATRLFGSFARLNDIDGLHAREDAA